MGTIIGEDGKEYYVVYCDSRFYDEYSQIAWQSALECAKKQLAKIRYWKLD